MRIAVVFHALHRREEVESNHAISLIADIWRRAGHEVRFLIGCDEQWDADVAIVHVDLSVVPGRYIRFARRYPAAVNHRIADIRKTRISRNLVARGSSYDGPVIVKTNLNSSGIPERVLLPRGRGHRLRRWIMRKGPETPVEFVKRYSVHESVSSIPGETLQRPGIVIEKFTPETDGRWYFIRRCFGLGSRTISYRMGETQPIVDGGDPSVFEWLDDDPRVLAMRKSIGLDYGVLDYVVRDGEVVLLDVTKTPGRANPPDAISRERYERIISHVATGIEGFDGPASGANQ
ncbi:MAG: hypothetical protein AB7Q29_16335 [Vicinamibacterales bacterium]